MRQIALLLTLIFFMLELANSFAKREESNLIEKLFTYQVDAQSSIFIDKDTKIYFLKSGQLESRDLVSGKRFWTSLQKNLTNISLSKSGICAIQNKNKVLGISTENGKRLWSYNVPSPQSDGGKSYIKSFTSSENCYLIMNNTVNVFDKSGKSNILKIKGNQIELVLSKAGISLWESTLGEPMQRVYIAYSNTNSKMLWTKSNPVKKMTDLDKIYCILNLLPDFDAQSQKIAEIDLKLGSILDIKTYDISSIIKQPFLGKGISIFPGENRTFAYSEDSDGKFIGIFNKNELLPKRVDLPTSIKSENLLYADDYLVDSDSGTLIGFNSNSYLSQGFRASDARISNIRLIDHFLIFIRADTNHKDGSLQVVDTQKGLAISQKNTDFSGDVQVLQKEKLIAIKSGIEVSVWKFNLY